MEVAELTAVLKAEVAGFMANLGAADRTIAQVRRDLADLEKSSVGVSAALNKIKIDQGQAAGSRAALDSIKQAVITLRDEVVANSAALQEMGISPSQVARFTASSSIMVEDLDDIGDAAGRARREVESLRMVQTRIPTPGGGPGTFGPMAYAGGMPESYARGGGADRAQTAAEMEAFLLSQRYALAERNGGRMYPLRRFDDFSNAQRSSSDYLSSLVGYGAASASSGDGGGGGSLGMLAALGFGAGAGGGIRVPRWMGPFGRGFRIPGAGFGSLGGLAGFGAERLLFGGLGVLGSMGGGVLGGGLLGAGALGTAAVGMGTDLAGIGQAAGDTKTVSADLGKLNTAISEYGKNSRQAAAAQLQLNTDLKGFSQVARPAVLAAAQQSQSFKAMFDKLTGPAEKVGAEILNQAMQVGKKFLPTIGKFAAENMNIIQSSLQPLFAWLQNSGKQGGLGIFTDLEKLFQKNLPTAIHAGTQAFELFLKVIDDAAHYTGGFTKSIDNFFTKWNDPANWGKVQNDIAKLIGLFHTWFDLFKSIGGLIVDVFRPAVGLGADFAKQLTNIINKTREWLSGGSMQDSLHGLFAAHKAELDAIFNIIRALLPALQAMAQNFVNVSGAMSKITAVGLQAIAYAINAIMRIPFVPQIVGWIGAILLMQKAIKGVITLMGVDGLIGMVKSLGPIMAGQVAIVDGALVTMDGAIVGTTAELSTMQKVLLSLGGSDVLGALAAAGGALAVLAAPILGLTLMQKSSPLVNLGVGTKGGGLGKTIYYDPTTGQIAEHSAKGNVINYVTAAQAAKDLGISLQQLKQKIGGAANDPGTLVGGVPKFHGKSVGYGGMYYTKKQVYQLLISQGATPQEAWALADISGREDGSGDAARLNNNPKTGDLSMGLFQENFIGAMGPKRVAKYAPEFGMSPNMSVQSFLSWLGNHPAAQAKIAIDILHGSGLKAWTTAQSQDFKALGGSGSFNTRYGTPDPTSYTGSTYTRPHTPSALDKVYSVAHQTALASATTNYQNALNNATTPKEQLKAAKEYLAVLGEQQKFLEAQKASGKAALAQQRELKTIADDIARAKREQAKAEKEIATAAKAQKEMNILGAGGTSGSVGSSTVELAHRLQQLKDMIARSPALDTASVKAQVNAINRVLAMGIADSTVRAQVAANLSDLNTTVKQHLQKIKDDAKAALSASLQSVVDFLTNMHQQADQLFDQITAKNVQAMTDSMNAQIQAMTDAMNEHIKNMQIMVHSAAGNFMFGGSITQTPAEIALSKLQDSHDATQRQLALTQAQQALIAAQATGNAQNIFNAQQQVNEALYAIQVANLQKQAGVQRTAADQQLADAQSAYQKQAQAEIDAYQKQAQAKIDQYQQDRDRQKTAMDQQFEDFIKQLEKNPKEAKKIIAAIIKIWSDNGIPMENAAVALGGHIYKGLHDALTPLQTLLDDLLTKLQKLSDLSGITTITQPDSPNNRGGSHGAAQPNSGTITTHVHVHLNNREIATEVRKQLILFGRSNSNIFGGLA